MEIMELKTNPGLLAAIDQAKSRKPTSQELLKQRISFIYGSLGQSSEVTRDKIRHVLEEQAGH